MKRLRPNTTATLTALLICATAPAGATAGPLLSGYGGPGEGNQAILGAALLNGPGGGKGGGSGSSSSSGGGSSSGVAARTEAGAKGAGGGSSGHGGTRSTRSHTHASDSRSPAYTPLSSPPITQTAAGTSTGAAGLSGADFLYILLAAAVLVLAGAITRRVARPAR
jgi:hypothetical protein